MDQTVCKGCRLGVVVTWFILGSICAVVVLMAGRYLRKALDDSRPLSPSLEAADRPWPTPPVAQAFDYPLQPPEAYGPYVQGLTGSRAIDTRFGAQNPAFGERSNCFRDGDGQVVPFSQLYHAGVDLFSMGPARQLLWGNAAGDPVRAVADGTVVGGLSAGAEGQILITQHRLPDGRLIYAVYWHVAQPQVAPGHAVKRGQVIGSVYDQGLNSHLHWEMRTFFDGSQVFPEGTAGTRGTCNGYVAGVGYTWDDIPERGRPEFYGYVDPQAFVEAHQ